MSRSYAGALVNMPDEDNNPLQRGDWVRMNELGRERHPRLASRVGQIIGISKYPDGVRVRWSGFKSAGVIYKSYLERISEIETSFPSEG